LVCFEILFVLFLLIFLLIELLIFILILLIWFTLIEVFFGNFRLEQLEIVLVFIAIINVVTFKLHLVDFRA